MGKPRSLSQKLFWISLSVGVALRYLWLGDIEYKGDEIYMFERVANSLGLSGGLPGSQTEPFPWLGMKSGVGPRNPGLSVWIFIALGHLFHTSNPVELARAVVTLNLTAFIAAHFFIQKVLKEKITQNLWYGGLALAAVNPFFILYQRKLWAQSVLGVFSILFLWAWFRRDTKKGAFFWGFLGALIGQIHMSGFIYAFAFVICDRFLKKKSSLVTQSASWFQGSMLGLLPMLPWIKYALNEKSGSPSALHFPSFHYWIVWTSESFGLHFGKIVGLTIGGPFYQQLESLWRFPQGSWMGLFLNASITLIALGLAILFFVRLWKTFKAEEIRFKIPENQTLLAIAIASAIYGLLLSLSVQQVHRFYLLVTFPLIFVSTVFLMNWIFKNSRRGFALTMSALLILEALTSFHFLAYIHFNGGAPQGDYGISFSEQVKQGKIPESGLLPSLRTDPHTGSTSGALFQ